MHVVCLQGGSAEAYKEGIEAQKFSLVGIVDGKSLLTAIFNEVERISHIKFDGYNGKKDKRLKYKNQKPAIYTAAGKRVSGTLADGAYLIFEGGLWRWPPLKVGHRRELESCTLVTMSVRPAVFQVVVSTQWFQTLSDDVLPSAQPLFRRSVTGDKDSGETNEDIRTSETAWLGYDKSVQLQNQESLTRQMLRVPLNRLEPAMQVVRYKPGQFYDSHRDYWDPREFPDNGWTDQNGRWNNRFATVLWYLLSPDKGGETWFPRARGEPIPHGEWRACDERGTKVKATNGTAVLFYSLLASGELDEFSWHCGCPVEGGGAKIAANSWVWSGVTRSSEKDEL